MNIYTENTWYKMIHNFREGMQTEVVYLQPYKKPESQQTDKLIYIIPTVVMLIIIFFMLFKKK